MSWRLRVDPIACDGHGLCAELLPERVSLDDWGYPIVDGTPIDGALVAHARRAVEACPVIALRLVRDGQERRSPVGLPTPPAEAGR
jgi:ferredoxin